MNAIVTHSHPALVVGPDGPGTLGVIRSLGEKGVNVSAIITTNKPSYVKHSRYLNEGRVFTCDPGELLQTLQQEFTVSTHRKHVLIPACDFSANVIDQSLNLLKPYFFSPGIDMQAGAVGKLMNKGSVVEMAKHAGLEVPGFNRLIHKSQGWGCVEAFPLPCIIKPCASILGGKDQIKVCRDRGDLSNYLFAIKDDGKTMALFVQEYVDAIDSFMINAMGLATRAGDVYIPGFFKKIRQVSNLKQCTNQDGNCSLARLSGESYGVNLDKVVSLLRTIRFSGLFDIEFKVVRGRPVFIELNLRIGKPNYMYTRAGANLPWLFYQDVQGHDVKATFRKLNSTSLGIMEQRDFLNVVERNISIFTWLRDMSRADAHMIYNRKDLKPALVKVFGSPSQVLRKIRKSWGKAVAR